MEIDFLRRTRIRWVRIHPLPSRRLRSKNSMGVSYLDSIEKFAEAGFNLVLPIDVGVKENVGVISGAHLSKFVDDSYSESFKAVKQIESRISRYDPKIIYGIENEVDTKEWILQSMPTVGWRQTILAWTELSTNQEIKHKRLRYILDGIREAYPEAVTMLNFEADNPVDNWNLSMSLAYSSEIVASKLGLVDIQTPDRMNNFKIDIKDALRRLRHVDIIGLDSYPNYFEKSPPRGLAIGRKADEIAEEFRKPVINVEFGYPAREPSWKKFWFWKKTRDLKRPSLYEHQETFFRNALFSIERSSSQGAFPWVLWLDPSRNYKPTEEKGFSLSVYEPRSSALCPLPSLQYYLDWIEKIARSDLPPRKRAKSYLSEVTSPAGSF